MSEDWYEEACHGWDGEEETLADQYPYAVGLVILGPIIIVAALLLGCTV